MLSILETPRFQHAKIELLDEPALARFKVANTHSDVMTPHGRECATRVGPVGLTASAIPPFWDQVSVSALLT